MTEKQDADKVIEAKIRGVVNREVDARLGTNSAGEKLVEIVATYHENANNSLNTRLVLDIDAARDLAYHLMDILLYGVVEAGK